MLPPSKRPPPGALARHKDLPRSITLLSHVRLLCAIQLSEPPPETPSAPFHHNTKTCGNKLTVIATRHAAARLAIGGSACVLLQVCVCDAAVAAGDRPVGVLAGHNGRVLGKGRGNSGEAKDDGGEGEVHFGEIVERKYPKI